MSRIKVLPVYPKFPTTFWGFQYALPYIGKKATMPPTGLATVLSMLPEEDFEPKRIIDLNVEQLRDEEIDNSDLIFTSTMIIQESSHNELIARAHAHGKKVVAGGPFPTSYPERNSGADYLVTGEAEITLPVFLEDFLRGTPQRTYTEQESIKRHNALLTRTGKADITYTPIPRWDLVNLDNYASAAIQHSRGCPFNCDFCDITKLFGREPRTKTPEQMVRELDALFDAGYRGSVFIVDDNFIGNRENVRKALPFIAEWQKQRGHPFQLFTEASMDLAWDTNEDILNGMAEAGFDQVFLGIESTDKEVLKSMKKGQNTKLSQLESVRRIQRAGLEVTAGFIIGTDGERLEAPQNLFEFIQEAGIPIAMPGLLTALKGTDLYNRLEHEGRIRGESDGNNTHYLGFNFAPLENERVLIEGYKTLIAKLFDPENYYERCRTLYKNQGEKEGINLKKRTDIAGLKAFARSVRKQLFARGGLEYAKHLALTALRHPRYFPEAVTQAVKLYHFKKITEATLKADAYSPQVDALHETFTAKARRIYDSAKTDVSDRINRIAELGRRVISKAERKYHKLHEDFRSKAEESLHRLKENITGVINNYKGISQAG